MSTITTETITQAEANAIARAALDGDTRYSHEAIGNEDADINAMEAEVGGRRIIRASNTGEVAVYERDGALVIVADANGPVAITIL